MRLAPAGLLVLGGWLPALALAADTKPSVVFDHRDAQRTVMHRLSLTDGQKFDVVVDNTAEACFDYSVKRVEPAADPEGTKGVKTEGTIELKKKVLSLVHEDTYGGYLVAVRRREIEGKCMEGKAKSLEDSTIIVSVETPGWDVEVSGGFTASGLTSTVYGVGKNEAGSSIVIEDADAKDDASLGVASFLHVNHKGQAPWVPSLGFGLGINETSKPTYHLGAFWRLGRACLLGGGVVLGSVDRLPAGVQVGGALSDPNLLATLPTRVEAQWFVGISFSFLGGKEPFQKPFGPPRAAQ